MGIEVIPQTENTSQKVGASKQEHYNISEVLDMKANATSIVKQLKEQIETGEYKTIIGDDASGRIPTLLFKKVLDKVTGGSVKTLFIGGGKGMWWNEEKEENIKNILSNYQEHIEGKALFVTEYLGGGEGMAKMAEQLEAAGIDFDIASLGSLEPEKHYLDEFKILKKHKLLIGSYSPRISPSVYKEHSISGVFKENKQDAIAKRIPVDQVYQKNISQTREDINRLAIEIINKVWSEEV